MYLAVNTIISFCQGAEDVMIGLTDHLGRFILPPGDAIRHRVQRGIRERRTLLPNEFLFHNRTTASRLGLKQVSFHFLVERVVQYVIDERAEFEEGLDHLRVFISVRDDRFDLGL